MPIDRGQDWGRPGPLPAGSPVVASDRELRDLVLDHRRRAVPLPVIGLVGGDLCRTLGGRGDRSRLTGADAVTVTVDLGVASIDGESTVFVAHLLVGRPFVGGTVVMQAQWCDGLDLAPRSHPADGRLDVTSGRLPFGQRRAARRRARSGTHLPHPDLRHRSVRSLALDLDRATTVVVDGVVVGRHRRIEVAVEPDALRIVVG